MSVSINSVGSASAASATWPASGVSSMDGPGADGDRPSRAQRKQVMDAAAKTLGMSSDDLRSALRSGQSLSDIASSKGVSQDTLTQAITSALSAGTDGSNASATSPADLASEVAKIIDHKGSGHHLHHQGGVAGAGSATDPGASALSACGDPTSTDAASADGASTATSFDSYM